MRLFIGIPLAQEVIDALERLARSLRSDGDGLRWSFAGVLAHHAAVSWGDIGREACAALWHD